VSRLSSAVVYPRSSTGISDLGKPKSLVFPFMTLNRFYQAHPVMTAHKVVLGHWAPRPCARIIQVGKFHLRTIFQCHRQWFRAMVVVATARLHHA